MKIRKMLSAFFSMTIVATMLSAFTVAQAANDIKFDAAAAYNAEIGGIEVTVSYSGFNDAVPYKASGLKFDVNGVMAISFGVENDASLSYMGGLTDTEDCAGIGSVGDSKPTYAFLATKPKELYTHDSGVLCKMYFAGDASTVATFSVKNIKFQTSEYVVASGGHVSDPVHDVADVSADFNKGVTPPVEEEVKTAIDGAYPEVTKDGIKAIGTSGTVTVPAGKSFSKIDFTFENSKGETGSYTWDFGTSISATTTYGLNIYNVPADVTSITCTSAEAK